MCTNELRVGSCNERRGITMHNLNFIADPLNKKLVQGRWYTLIGINPITSKYEVEVTLHLGDEERRSNHLAPNGQLHRSNPLGTNGITSSNAANCHVCLDQFFVRPAEHLVQ